jgi:hypothetical protein
MPIEMACPGCGKTLRLGDEHAGKTGRCPNCQQMFPIPLPGAANSGSLGSPLPSAQPAPEAQPANRSPSSRPLFGEGTHTASGTFADHVNPYSTTPPHSTVGQTAPADPSAITSTILGTISILLSFMVCCCPLNLLGIPVSILGVILAYQAPVAQRTLPLALNLVGLVLTVLFFLAALGIGGPQFLR